MEKGNKKLNLKAVIIAGWIVFILMAVIYFMFFYKKLPVLGNDADVDSKYIYETNENLDINVLIISYLDALEQCDQATLQSLVTDPSEFDDMTSYQKKAEMILEYSNTDCYTVEGNTEDTFIVYAVFRTVIANVESTPMDILEFYVVKTDSGYLIDNTEHDAETQAYIEEIRYHEDIQKLYETVYEDEKRCLEEDETYYEFYQKIWEQQ